MKKLVILSLLAFSLNPFFCFTQGADSQGFKPSSVNQQGKQYPMVNAEGQVRIRIAAPDANYVKLDIGGVLYDLTKDMGGEEDIASKNYKAMLNKIDEIGINYAYYE
jgi:hypothetical protein